jgi:hypothetical protein
MLAWFEQAAFEIGDAFVEDRGVPGSGEVVRGGVGQPDTIVADTRANALPGRR